MSDGSLDTFGNQSSRELSFSSLMRIFQDKGVGSVYVKELAPNDNSKNQIYLGGDFSALNIIPIKKWESFLPKSEKPTLKPKAKLIRGSVDFSWIDSAGRLHEAPETKLILYPQYPEVRLSGFLKNSGVKASEWMDVSKSGRSLGRFLIIAIHPDGYCIGFLAVPGSLISVELISKLGVKGNKVLIQIDFGSVDSKTLLLKELKRIHFASPVTGKILVRKSGIAIPYKARNGAGYTLEAELGIAPNGFSEPDFKGWEVKVHGTGAVTLMTPEPSGGVYKAQGVEAFIRTYGYPDKSGILNRFNFGGVHKINVQHATTKLTMRCIGFESGGRLDLDGSIALLDSSETIAAEWSFQKILEHWNRKHAKAVYVPYLPTNVAGATAYSYGSWVDLGVGTDFLKFMESMMSGRIYYDPGIKLENANSPKPTTKRRSQFRVNYKNLTELYDSWERTTLLD